MFDLKILKDRYEQAVGYQLFKDYGELSASYRLKNEVIHPVIGVFRVEPMTVTAIPSPFIGVASATVEMVVVPERVAEVEKKMNDVAMMLNGSSFFIADEGVTYAVTYSMQTAAVGEKADIPWYHGAVLPIRQTVVYSIIEGGFPASEVELKIDGYTVPFLSLVETMTQTTSVYPDASGKGTTAAEMSAFGIDITMPHLIDDPLSDIINGHLERDRGNRALCVELKKAGESTFRIMSIVSVSESAQSPQNVGMNVSLAELSDIAGVFNDLWKFVDVEGLLATPGMIVDPEDDSFPEGVVVFWGDGTAEKNPSDVHFYTDGKTSHTAIAFDLSDGYAEPKRGDVLYGVTLYTSEMRSDALVNGTWYMKTEDGEGIVVYNSRVTIALKDASGKLYNYPIDRYLAGGESYVESGKEIVVPFKGAVESYDSTELMLLYRKREREDV